MIEVQTRADDDIEKRVGGVCGVERRFLPVGRDEALGLAALYCDRGQSDVQAKKYEFAVADLEKSVVFTDRSDGCSCEPYNTLAYIYIDEQKQYDKGWDLVHRAQSSNQLIASECVERLKQGSGRNQ